MDEIEAFKKACEMAVEKLRRQIKSQHGSAPSVEALARVELRGNSAREGALLGDVARMGPEGSGRVRVRLARADWEKAARKAIEGRGLSLARDGNGDLMVKCTEAAQRLAIKRIKREAAAAVEAMRHERRKARKALGGRLDERLEGELARALQEGEERARAMEKAGLRI